MNGRVESCFLLSIAIHCDQVRTHHYAPEISSRAWSESGLRRLRRSSNRPQNRVHFQRVETLLVLHEVPVMLQEAASLLSVFRMDLTQLLDLIQRQYPHLHASPASILDLDVTVGDRGMHSYKGKRTNRLGWGSGISYSVFDTVASIQFRRPN